MINFRKLRWKNLLSTGSVFTEIDLCRSTDTLIVGSNGAGKSTILDALCFSLFGKPFRKINKPNLLNSINMTDCVVEIEFEIGSKLYKVIRGIKPNIFEIYCNNILVNQDAKSRDYQEYLETNILRLNYKSFTQVVILGSASFVPFMQLTAADRRTIIEELLDIQIFSSMNNVVKEKMTLLKENLSQVNYTIDLTKEKIDLQLHNIEESKKNNDAEILVKEKEITQTNKFIKKTQNKIDEIGNEIKNYQNEIQNKSSIEKKYKSLLQIESKIENQIGTLQKEYDNLSEIEENAECTSCKQPIPHSHKEHLQNQTLNKISEKNKALDEVKLAVQNENEKLQFFLEIQNKINLLQNELSTENAHVYNGKKYIGKLQTEIENLTKKKNSLEYDNERLTTLREELLTSSTTKEQLLVDKQYYEFAAVLLKDTGIKTKIIKQYLPIINKLINKYLNSMDFFVNFNIDENFEETIKSRHRDEFSYANFSEGEKQKIDLALLFTWRQIAKLKNSASTNLLILDEVFDSSLDTTSTDLLMSILHEVAKETHVFVISHKGDQLFDKFRSVIRFEKKGNFSKIVK